MSGIEKIRTSTPLVKSLLVCGPRKSGKSTLVNALCHDIGATLFDLTPSNIVGRYPGKAGLNMLTHLVLKVSKSNVKMSCLAVKFNFCNYKVYSLIAIYV